MGYLSMKIRFNKKQWDNFLFVNTFAKWRYKTDVEPIWFIQAFPNMYYGVK